MNSFISWVCCCCGVVSNVKWCVELGGDGLYGSVGVCYDNYVFGVSIGVGYILFGVLVVLLRVVVDWVVGNLFVVGFGNVVGVVDIGCSWNDGLLCFGISFGFSLGCCVLGYFIVCFCSWCVGCYFVVGDVCWVGVVVVLVLVIVWYWVVVVLNEIVIISGV